MLLTYRELLYDKPRPPQCCGIQGFAKPKIGAMQITMMRGEDLPPQDKDGGKVVTMETKIRHVPIISF